MKYILWDIDGTLLRTGKAGLKALEQTMLDLYNQPIHIDFSCAGRTDTFIAQELFKQIPHHAELDIRSEVPKILQYYADILPPLIKDYRHLGMIFPHVVENLEYLHQQPDYTSVLLTGNIMLGARAKLIGYGLNHFFNYELSGFADNHTLRNEIAADCLRKIQAHDPHVQADDLIVVGDTPHDIMCANHIGARCIAVATNGSLDELAQLNPWHACQELPTVDKFKELLRF